MSNMGAVTDIIKTQSDKSFKYYKLRRMVHVICYE